MEIKTVMVYPQSSPGKRHMFAGDLSPAELQPMMRGLLNKAGVTEGWDKDSLVALRNLTTRVDSMDYTKFTSQGYPIDSGQIEGMNKNVIGKRMKCSGMHWSRGGADRMAARRAEIISENPLLDYDQLRFQAYPHQPSCP